MGFLTEDDAPIIWRGPMLHGALQQFFREVRWVDLDYLIIDMPPGTGDVALSLSQTVPVAGAIVVTTPQQVSLADSRRAVAMYKKLNIPTLGIIENMSYFVCPNCQHEADIFGHGGGEQMAARLGMPFLGRIPIYQPIREGSDSRRAADDRGAGFAGGAGVHARGRAARGAGLDRQLQPADDSAHRGSMNIPFSKHTLENGLDVLLHEDHACPIVAVNIWYHVGSKNETPGRTGFAHLFEHLMFEGSEHHDHGYFQPLQGAGALAERIDQRRSHELLGSGADQRARARAVDGVGSHGLSAAGADRGQVHQPARRRAERAAPELREPPVRPRADGDAGGAVSARSSVSLDDDRRDRRSAGGAGSKKCARSSPPTTTRPTRRSRSPATSIPTRRSRWSRRYFGEIAAGTAGQRRCSLPSRRCTATRGCCSRIASSCRGCTSRGSRRRCSRTTMRSSISRPTCSPTARRRGSTAGWCSTSALATDVSASQNSREMRRLRADRRDRRARPHAGRARTGDRRGDRAARGRRPDRRRDRARPRPGRSAVHVPPADGRRLRRQVRSAERLQRVPQGSRLTSPATWRATTTSRAESLREAVQPLSRALDASRSASCRRARRCSRCPARFRRSFHESACMTRRSQPAAESGHAAGVPLPGDRRVHAAQRAARLDGAVTRRFRSPR